MFTSIGSRALRSSLSRQAGYTTYRTTMVEAIVRAGRDHNDVKVIYGFCILGSSLLFGIFYHSAKDPRYATVLKNIEKSELGLFVIF